MLFPFLKRMGVPNDIQQFFSESITTDQVGNPLFEYETNLKEHFGLSFHLVPIAHTFWQAGCKNYRQVKQVFICSSAMEAVAFMTINAHQFKNIDQYLFLSPGCSLNDHHIYWLNTNLDRTNYSLIFPNDVLGNIYDVKIALATMSIPVRFTVQNDQVVAEYKSQTFRFDQASFSLFKFSKATGFRPVIKHTINTYKSKTQLSFLDQLVSSMVAPSGKNELLTTI